ncbi:MAG: chemotaxis protein CheV [gamma proteobacterium symbiont of Phacoides pectinatus]
MADILKNVDQRTKLAGHNRLELLLFRLLGRERYGINVFKVHKVIQVPEMSKLPGSHPAVRGVIQVREKTLSVIDLSMAVGLEPLGEQGRFVIVTEYNRQVIGFLVRAVEQIANLSWEDISPPPNAGVRGCYVTAVARINQALVEIIDVEQVLQDVVGLEKAVTEAVAETLPRERQAAHRILVADDSTVARNQVKRVLDKLGVETVLVTDGRQALDQLKAWASEGRRVAQYLDMVISDIEMPVMDGYTLTREIREDPALAEQHVILHSSLSGMFNDEMIKSVGADDFLAKYDPDELAQLVVERIRTLEQGSAGGTSGDD